MAREIKQAKTVLKTDGREHVWDAVQDQVDSETHLEDDEGHGGAAIIRQFKFGVNPTAFRIHKPTRQELFNSHLKQIELWLWKDGMKLLTEVMPRISLDEKGKVYSITVGAVPQKGHMVLQRPKLLKELV